MLWSRITNRLKSLSTADIDPENAVEELMEMFENDDDKEEEKDDTKYSNGIMLRYPLHIFMQSFSICCWWW